MADKKDKDEQDLPPLLDVQVPKLIHLVEIYAKRGQKVPAENLVELIEQALHLDGTSLFASSDTVCITFVRQGGP